MTAGYECDRMKAQNSRHSDGSLFICSLWFRRDDMEKIRTEWKQIYQNGVLLYEGFATRDNIIYGAGCAYWPDGNKYMEGWFGIKGLLYGKEYYPDGTLRFEAAYALNYGYGPNYPVYGKMYDVQGNCIHEGMISCEKSGLGYPVITVPAGFGYVSQSGKPDLPLMMWHYNEQNAK